MAEKTSPKVFAESTEENIDCAVCLQPCVHPTVLPCRHVFCFLCVKGLGRTTRTCAMCRQQFPTDVLENPSLLRPEDVTLDSGFEDGQQWYYEGRNGGWWQYECRISTEIEQAYKTGQKKIDVIICGELYVIDLELKVQYQKHNPIRKRNIQRSSVHNMKAKGWWQYDERTSKEIEVAFQEGSKSCEVSISGRIYMIDFDNMEQRQKFSIVRARRIKRDSISIAKKGVSGIRAPVRTSDDDIERRFNRLNLRGPSGNE